MTSRQISFERTDAHRSLITNRGRPHFPAFLNSPMRMPAFPGFEIIRDFSPRETGVLTTSPPPTHNPCSRGYFLTDHPETKKPMPDPSTRTTVLFLDDCPNEHLLLRWAARLADVPLKIQHFTNPRLVKAYLHNERPFANRRLHVAPALALLDFDLGKDTSLELVHWIRAQRKFRNLPVVMYTSTDDVGVVRACYSRGASFFLHKPSGFDRLQIVVQALANCFQSRPPEFSSLHCLPEHLSYSRGHFNYGCWDGQ